jgi:hypothetical protein
MQLIEVFKESLRLMEKEPKVFVPRILMSALYTFLILYTTKFVLEISWAIRSEMDFARQAGLEPDIGRALLPFSTDVWAFFLFVLFVSVVDLLSYGMYARITGDFHSKIPVSLSRALNEAFRNIGGLLLIGTLATLFVGIFSVISLIFVGMYFLTQNYTFSVAALAVIAVAIVLFPIVFFLAVPIAIVEQRGAKSAILKSMSLGMKHKGPVVKTNFLFLALLFITMIVVALTEFDIQNPVTLGAIILFIITRLFQAIIYTYISIINPALYLSIEEVADDAV